MFMSYTLFSLIFFFFSNKEILLQHRFISSNNATDEQCLAALKERNWTIGGQKLPECSMESELDQVKIFL